ncbi:MAG TPA: response regulator [Anaerolineaceae bacterium]|nr:response regulator [Anaerolineaceae bacterium]
MSIPYGPILVVEDNPNVLELLEITLRFKGYPVVTAQNGQEALEKIAKERPALVITDILMPKMDGYALAHALQKNPLTLQIPIVFISATYVTQEDRQFALNLGAVRFIEKPIDTEDFLLTVAEILTQGISTSIHRPLEEEEFYEGYRKRLEHKLRHKNAQMARTERLLQSLSEEQKPAFEALLANAANDRDEIQVELNELYHILDQFKSSDHPAE